ncbi:MAG: archease [Candidatus Altiarchaeota archaeon]
MGRDFDFLDHTADFKFRAYGSSLEDAFENSAKALFSYISDFNLISSRIEKRFDCVAETREELLHHFLTELIFLFESEELLFCGFEVSISDGNLSAVLKGEKYNPKMHRLFAEVKAVTYHDLKIEEDGGQWVIEVLCDT